MQCSEEFLLRFHLHFDPRPIPFAIARLLFDVHVRLFDVYHMHIEQMNEKVSSSHSVYLC